MVLTLDILKKILRQKTVSSENSIHESIENAPINNLPSKLEEIPPLNASEERLEPSTSSVAPEVPNAITSAHIKDDIVILRDATGLMLGEGRIDDIRSYFQDRFEKLRKLLLKRPDCKSALTIQQAKAREKSDEPIRVIGMVFEKKEMSSRSNAKNRNKTLNSLLVTLDDLESTIEVIFPGKNEALLKKANRLIPDQVICVEGFITEQKKLIASDVFRPDVPYHTKKKQEIPPISVIFISDTHFGSKYFLADKFEAFLNWLKGKNIPEEQKMLANSVKYIVFAGDLVDGVGVYPNQEKNLAIIDISEQYNLAAQYLARIPKHIKVIIIPGGPHDAVRKGYPQPALSKKYAGALYEIENIILLGNPAYISLHGINILIFHGDSLDDLIQVIPGLSYDRPAEIMKELIINRHLTPLYGYSTWIAPEKEDWMVIDEIPEILHCGHTHVSDFKEYRGILLLNSGTFQAETDYQRSLGIKPTPGKIPIVNLRTLQVKFLQF